MIEVKPTKTARNAIIGAGFFIGLLTIAKLSARDGYHPWILALGIALVVTTAAGAVLYASRMRVRVVNGELLYRPLVGAERRLPISSVDRVLFAPKISQSFGPDQGRFVVIGVDRKVFIRLNPNSWDPSSFAELTKVFTDKGELVTATAVADIRKQAPLVLTEGELHPGRLIGRTFLIAGAVIVVVMAIVFAVGGLF
jgi:hypothetical protein